MQSVRLNTAVAVHNVHMCRGENDYEMVVEAVSAYVHDHALRDYLTQVAQEEALCWGIPPIWFDEPSIVQTYPLKICTAVNINKHAQYIGLGDYFDGFLCRLSVPITEWKSYLQSLASR